MQGKLYREYKQADRLSEHRNGECFLEVCGDLVNSEELLAQRAYAQHSDTDRYSHIVSVAYISFLICRRLKLDYREAARAALLHDLTFYDWHEPSVWHRLHGIRHPRFALYNARIISGGTLSKKQEDIIYKHMWPLTLRPPRYAESWVVTFADKYCAVREMMK